jgi:hypothetical protein
LGAAQQPTQQPFLAAQALVTQRMFHAAHTGSGSPRLHHHPDKIFKIKHFYPPFLNVVKLFC